MSVRLDGMEPTTHLQAVRQAAELLSTEDIRQRLAILTAERKVLVTLLRAVERRETAVSPFERKRRHTRGGR